MGPCTPGQIGRPAGGLPVLDRPAPGRSARRACSAPRSRRRRPGPRPGRARRTSPWGPAPRGRSEDRRGVFRSWIDRPPVALPGGLGVLLDRGGDGRVLALGERVVLPHGALHLGADRKTGGGSSGLGSTGPRSLCPAGLECSSIAAATAGSSPWASA